MQEFAANQDSLAPIVGAKRGSEVSIAELEFVGNVRKTDQRRAIDHTDRDTQVNLITSER